MKVTEVKYLAQVKASKSNLKNQLLKSRAQDLSILLSCVPGAVQGYHLKRLPASQLKACTALGPATYLTLSC